MSRFWKEKGLFSHLIPFIRAKKDQLSLVIRQFLGVLAIYLVKTTVYLGKKGLFLGKVALFH